MNNYRITIVTASWTIHVDGPTKKGLQEYVFRLVQDLKLQGEISKPKKIATHDST